MRFWDSSALIPLVINESKSPWATARLEEDDELVVWTLTPVEILSALERRVREGTLTERQALAADELAVELIEGAHEVIAIEAAKTLARRLLRTHPLRTADALQLAAALLWAENSPDGSVLLTLDRRLGMAALREGFAVLPDLVEEG